MCSNNNMKVIIMQRFRKWVVFWLEKPGWSQVTEREYEKDENIFNKGLSVT